MTTGEQLGVCNLCGSPGAVGMEPPRRTLARGADPADPSLSVIAVLPDVVLCHDHAVQVEQDGLSIGWCDSEECRLYGVLGIESPCGEPFKTIKR